MKTGQLLEYNLWNIFLEKSYSKCGGETIPRLFSTKSKLNIEYISGSVVQSFVQFIFIVWQVENYPNILKLSYCYLM